MSNKIILKHGAGAPADGVLDEAELGFDTTEKKLYIGYSDNNVLKILPIESKSAYEYAKEGGYTGTEADFVEKLAKEYISKDETSSQKVQLTLEDGSTIIARIPIFLN